MTKEKMEDLRKHAEKILGEKVAEIRLSNDDSYQLDRYELTEQQVMAVLAGETKGFTEKRRCSHRKLFGECEYWWCEGSREGLLDNANEETLGTYGLTEMEGCCGIAIVTELTANVKGAGQIVLEMAKEDALRRGYTVLIGTDQVQNRKTTKMCKSASMPQLFQFRNNRSGNRLNFFAVNLRNKSGKVEMVNDDRNTPDSLYAGAEPEPAARKRARRTATGTP
jgi:hypothetical protein